MQQNTFYTPFPFSQTTFQLWGTRRQQVTIIPLSGSSLFTGRAGMFLEIRTTGRQRMGQGNFHNMHNYLQTGVMLRHLPVFKQTYRAGRVRRAVALLGALLDSCFKPSTQKLCWNETGDIQHALINVTVYRISSVLLVYSGFLLSPLFTDIFHKKQTSLLCN